jgi:serine/threonine protein kinase
MAITGLADSLDAWRNGKATQRDVEAALAVELNADPHLVPAARAIIDAYRRGGYVPEPFAKRLLSLGPLAMSAASESPDEPPPQMTAVGLTLWRTSRMLDKQPPDDDGPTASETLYRLPAYGPSVQPPFADPSARVTVGVGSVLSGQYILESILPGTDSGALGTVFRARDLVLEEAQDRNPYVALKVLNEQHCAQPESRKALHRAARNAQQLSHPNIINVQNVSFDGSHAYIVMELLEGQPLTDILRAVKNVGLPPRDASRIALALTRALTYAHQQRIVHADFKPSNVFVTRDGAIKVLDFGFAHAAGLREAGLGAADAASRTATRIPRAASLAYASCEQIQGDDPDPRDDVYALSVVSYELLTGRHPFDGRDAAQARDAALKAQPIAGISRRHWNTIQAGLSFVRERRPRDAQAFGEGMMPKRWPVTLLAIGGLAIALMAVAGSLLFSNLLDRRRSEAIARDLASPDAAVAAGAVQQLLKADQGTTAFVLSQEGARNVVLTILERRARDAFDPARHLYNFQAAKQELSAAKRLLKDSASLRQFEESLEAEQKLEATH